MSTTSDDDEPTPNPSTTDRKPRYKKRKIAIFLAYCGVGYQGMQKNPGAKTIEGDLEEALYLAGAVPESDRGNPKRFDWARSARTDKGVSAVGQVVSGRFYVDPPGLVDRLNSNLPHQIRIFGYKRATASFNAKKFCDRRRYVYLIPVFALDPNSHPDRESVLASLGSDNELAKCLECSDRGRKVFGVMGRRNSESRITNCEGKAVIESRVSAENNGDAVSKSETVLESTELGVVEETKVSSVEENLEPNLALIGNGEAKGLPANGVALENNVDAVSNSEIVFESTELGEVEETVFESTELGVVEETVFESTELGVVEETKVSSLEVNPEPNLALNGNGEAKGLLADGVAFHYGEKERERFNRILKHFVGTHNFHNFTTRTKAEDPSARRYIVSFDANSVVNVEGLDFVKCEVVGQSFMLHQIRKMIGLAVAVMRNCAPESLVDVALQQDVRITVPTAPEVGLYLDECLFTSYNQKWKETHEEISMKAYAEEAEDFKMQQIYSHIAATEQKEGAVALWLHSLNHRNYPDLYFLGENGVCTNGENAQVGNMAE